MHDFLKQLGIAETNSGAAAGDFLPAPTGGELASTSPNDGSVIATVRQASAEDYDAVVAKAHETFLRWRTVPGPVRGEIVRQIGLALREHKDALGRLVSLEMGKIVQEGWGEVQEMIDMADFAVGQSRMCYGKTMLSERPGHRMMEQWHPLGVVGVISAFNFPVAVYAWNALLAAVCGDTILWKPSSKTPLTAIAVHRIFNDVAKEHGWDGVFNLVIGSGRTVGEKLLHDPRIPLVSATGSCRMGRRVGEVVGGRLGRTILELGGNNAIIVLEDAEMEMAVPAIVFGAVGTAGQRCTSTRRILVQEGIADALVERLVKAYEQVPIGDPLDERNLCGPLIDKDAVATMQRALENVRAQGGEIVYGGEVLEGPGYESGCYVKPCIVRAKADLPMMQDETFAPILYVVPVADYDEAIRVHNDVPQGLSSAIFTQSLRAAETFLSPAGSDCGIANANIGTSGAEIGGAFGGEKETGGGRESGSDAWKAYMRRQTNTVNYSRDLPLAQGIRFEV